MEIVVISNPISGRSSRRAALARFNDLLTARGRAVLVHETTGPGDGAARAAQAAREGVDIVVAAGGDGTVNDVASGLLEVADTPTRLGILPFGTSNLVARELGIPLDPVGAGDVIAEGVARRFDVGVVDGRVFLACVGFGWDASIVRSLSSVRKGHIGFTSYVRPTWSATWGYSFPELTVRAEGGEEARGEIVVVLNARPYAAFFTLSPDARPDDGLLDVVVLKRRGPLDVPRWMMRALRGTLLRDRGATLLRTARLSVTGGVPVPYQIDGDVGGDTPADMLVRPGALRVLAPPARDQDARTTR